MSNIGTFGMFTTVRLGIYTSQHGLNLTGNNIANINTTGYTRQTLNIKSLHASGVDRYLDSSNRVGSGAYVSGISQLRDPYLDIRYRTECASVGYMDTKLSNLNDLAAILDEVGDGDDQNGIISAQFNDILAALENLTEYTGQGEFDTQVRSSAAALVSLFNSYANKLEQVETNAVDRFKQDMVTVNELLKNIQNLSTNIRKGDIHGVPSLEMRDERNRLIDELSQYIKIDVRYEMENIAPGVDVERLKIRLADNYDPEICLVDGIYAVQLIEDETMPEINPAYDGVNVTDKYLDANGNPVNDVELANRVANTNFNLTLSRLTDNQGNVMSYYDNDQIYGATPVTANGNVYSVTFGGVTYDLSDKIAELIASGEDRLSWTTDEAPDGTQNEFTLKMITAPDPNDPTQTITTYEVSMAVRQNATEVSLGDNALYGSLQAAREFLTECGEFATSGYSHLVDPNAATKRGVKYYRHALDLLANKFAETMNTANNGYLYSHDPADDKYYYVDNTGAFITDANGNRLEKKATDQLTADEIALLNSKNCRAANSGNLFSTRGDNNDGEGITASNISISAAWASGDVQIVNSYAVIPGTDKVGTTDNTNILHMVTLMNKDLYYSPSEIVANAKTDTMFIGSFGEMLGNINAVLGNDQSSTSIMLDNYYASAVELDTNRDSVSSVDLNDETVNMIQYQKSYSAACRLMTTMDEILDKLINGTGVAGR